MDAYDRCTNLGKKIVPVLLLFMVETENFSYHPLLLIRSSCWITKAADTHSEQAYVIRIAFPQQQCLHERA
jgi:hypothetical protein